MLDMPLNSTEPNHIYLIYMYKEDLALNNLQGLICQYKPNETKSNETNLSYLPNSFIIESNNNNMKDKLVKNKHLNFFFFKISLFL